MTICSAFGCVVSPFLQPLGFRQRGRMFGKYLEKEKLFIYLAYEMFHGSSNYRIWTSIVSVYDPCPIYNNRVLILSDPKCGAIQRCAEEECGFRFFEATALPVWEKYTPEQFMDSLRSQFRYYYKMVCDLNQIDSLDALYEYSKNIFDKAGVRVNMRLPLLPLAFVLGKKEDAFQLAEGIYAFVRENYEKELRSPYATREGLSRLAERMEQRKKMKEDVEKWNVDVYLEDIYSEAKDNEKMYKKYLR